jgi:hypothetical protein
VKISKLEDDRIPRQPFFNEYDAHVFHESVGSVNVRHCGKTDLGDDGANLPLAAEMPRAVEQCRVRNTSPRMTKGVTLGLKFWKRFERQ